MDRARISDAAARHAGLVMTHAAAIASVLCEGELICPFAVVTKGENRESVAFEAETQDEAVARGWESLDTWRKDVDSWAFAREGLIRGAKGKKDVLLVAAWTPGMAEPAVFIQCFLPRTHGGFALIGPTEVQDASSAELERLRTCFDEGVREHPKGHMWSTWRKADA